MASGPEFAVPNLDYYFLTQRNVPELLNEKNPVINNYAMSHYDKKSISFVHRYINARVCKDQLKSAMTISR